jgi:hypothetical protein
MNMRIGCWAGSADKPAMMASAASPRMVRAKGSVNTLPPSNSWWAARYPAAPRAVRLGCRSFIDAPVLWKTARPGIHAEVMHDLSATTSHLRGGFQMDGFANLTKVAQKNNS